MKNLFRFKSAFLILSLFLIVFVPFHGRADDNIIEVNSEGVSDSAVPATARAESLKDAINKACLQIIGNLIGDARMEKSLPTVRSKVLSQTAKFVQFYKAQEPVKKGDNTSTSVNMKVSITSLKDILAKEGLLNESEGPATILPVIKVSEKRENGRQYLWWTEEAGPNNSFLREQEKTILHHLDGLFRPKNFYLIDPIASHYVQWMPQPYRAENPNLDDLLWMGDFFRAQIIIAGDVVLETGSVPENIRVNIKLTAYQSNNGRVVAEVTRSFESPSNGDWDLAAQQVIRKGFAEIGKDLTGQVIDEWNSGTLGSTLLKIGLSGPYGFQDLENFKKQIIAKIGDVKKIRERRMEKGDTTFEVDYAGGLPNLIKGLQSASFEGFRVGVAETKPDQVDLRWSKVGGK